MEETFAKYINVNGELMDLSRPQVMGILNVTPDSFYADSRKQAEEDIVNRVHQIIEEGGCIIDIGAYSSRQDAEDVSPEEEMKRLKHGLQVIQREFPDAIVSVDTFRADVARMCVEEYGTAIINDISAGDLDANMFSTVAKLKVPYIMMHMQGNPQNMQRIHITSIRLKKSSFILLKNREAPGCRCKRPYYRSGIWFRKNTGT